MPYWMTPLLPTWESKEFGPLNPAMITWENTCTKWNQACRFWLFFLFRQTAIQTTQFYSIFQPTINRAPLKFPVPTEIRLTYTEAVPLLQQQMALPSSTFLQVPLLPCSDMKTQLGEEKGVRTHSMMRVSGIPDSSKAFFFFFLINFH